MLPLMPLLVPSLEDDGSLAINRAALKAVKASEDVEFASYARLKVYLHILIYL